MKIVKLFFNFSKQLFLHDYIKNKAGVDNCNHITFAFLCLTKINK